jgi:hypothetical protein
VFLCIPADEGMITPQIKIASVYIEQIGAYDTGVKIAQMNNTPVYPTVEEALTLGGINLLLMR